jgi:redox-sensitive bicupin YhaK (pirin superfamily)
MNHTARLNDHSTGASRLGTPVAAKPHSIGTGFKARHFSEEMFAGQMDPLLMVDHFVMTEPTFDPHLHAGISAVTVLFEDAEGEFLNRDTLGHNISLKAGDLYWLAAASGAVHEELPSEGARTHALQIFVNLPAHLKQEPARSLHVLAKDVPVVADGGHLVRVLLGSSNGVTGATGTPEEMSMLDGYLASGAQYVHTLPVGRQAWIYVVSGEIAVHQHEEVALVPAGEAIAIAAGDEVDITVDSAAGGHFVLMAAKPIRERFVKHGPLVMSSAADVRQTLVDYANGRFGRIGA